LPAANVAGRLMALRRLIRKEQPDVVHTSLFEADVLGRIASIGLGSVVISSLVNTSYDPIRLHNRDIKAVKLAAARTIDTWTARYLTAHFHAVSDAVKDAAVVTMRLPPDRITVIERGRCGRFNEPSAQRRKIARLKLGLNETDEVIVNVGRQEYQKGQQYLLKAMVEVALRRPNTVLLIAGRQGHQSRRLEELRKELDLGDRVRLLGHREDVPDILTTADLFAFPSLYEGLGGALLEAMAFGLPIVATRLPAIGCVVEEGRNALLVERATVAPLAEAMIDLLADPDKAKAFGNRSREIFEARFTLDRCAARMIEFYRDIVTRDDRPIVAHGPSEFPCR